MPGTRRQQTYEAETGGRERARPEDPQGDELTIGSTDTVPINRLSALIALDATTRGLTKAQLRVLLETRGVTGWIGCLTGRPGDPVALLIHQHHNGRPTEIHLLAIDPDYAARGFAGRMIRDMAAWAERLGRQGLTVHVIETDLASQVFYRDLGFRHAKTIAGTPRDTYLLQRAPAEGEEAYPLSAPTFTKPS